MKERTRDTNAPPTNPQWWGSFVPTASDTRGQCDCASGGGGRGKGIGIFFKKNK